MYHYRRGAASLLTAFVLALILLFYLVSLSRSEIVDEHSPAYGDQAEAFAPAFAISKPMSAGVHAGEGKP